MGGGCRMCDILSWREPAIAGATLLSFNLLYLLVYGFQKTILSMSCWLCLGFLMFGLLLRLLGMTTTTDDHNSKRSSSLSSSSSSGAVDAGDGAAGGYAKLEISKDGSFSSSSTNSETVVVFDYEIVSRETLEEIITAVYVSLNWILSRAREVVFWSDWFRSLRWCICLWCVAYFFSLFTLPATVFVAVWAAFLFTAGWKVWRDNVQPAVSPQFEKVKRQFGHVWSAVPRMDDAVNKKSKQKKV